MRYINNQFLCIQCCSFGLLLTLPTDAQKFAIPVMCEYVCVVCAYLVSKSEQKTLLGRRTTWCVYAGGEFHFRSSFSSTVWGKFGFVSVAFFILNVTKLKMSDSLYQL